MGLGEIFGYSAAVCVFLTFYMKTMVPLRIAGIASNVLFILYGFYAGAHPVLILHLALLPLNIWRLHEMQQLMRQMREATHGDLNMEWLKPFTATRNVSAGETLFRKGETANNMMVVMSGRFRLQEIDVTVEPGAVVGELGFLALDHKRMATLKCEAPVQVLVITYDQLKQVYFQNKQFGFYFLQLTTRRLFENIVRLEQELAQRPMKPAPQAGIELQ